MKPRVIIAMSGGVDSSVAAALLKKAGFDVIGVHMKFWAEGDKKGNRCCTVESEKMARLISKKIGIPFYVLNFKNEFKKAVVDYFIKTSKQGETPNPCVVCNKEIKFGLLFKKAKALGADFIATGHYARIKEDKGVYELLKGKDKNKDQSYFLWKLDQKVLKHVLFPVGGYTKQEVRKIAQEFKLPVANTAESMEVCFIKDAVEDFLKRFIKTKPGNIVNNKGKVLGSHDGLYFYTIGQRKGIGLPGGPYYVLRKDTKNNELVVTENEKDLFKKELVIKDAKWILGVAPKGAVTAKIRYGSKGATAVVKNNKVIFSKAQRAITPGQSVVFYKGEEMLGGAIILDILH